MFEGLFQPMHVFLILIVVLVIFGPGKLPDIGKGLGEAEITEGLIRVALVTTAC